MSAVPTSPAPAAVRQLSPTATARLLGDWRGGGAAYRALADALRAAVLAGSLPPLTRVPSERELAAAPSASRAPRPPAPTPTCASSGSWPAGSARAP
ncbi:hypothetical protein ABE437_16635 [Isoptericola cucumis]|uniref:hypothetical protein n=1 Tax=Isoptericola cucumis TaxID=1776856 RepID=UPI003209BAE9